jgi:hypothetical protein
LIEAGALGGGLPFCSPELVGQIADEISLGAAKSCTTLTTTGVMWQTIIHCVFIASAIGIAWTERLMAGLDNQRERALDAH